MQDLSYLLGETSIPTPAPADRQTYIQRALERVYRKFNFDLNMVVATVAFNASGTINLPADAAYNPKMDVRAVKPGVGSDTIFGAVPYEDQDNYGQGDNAYWLTGVPGSYVLTTTETPSGIGSSYVTIRYEQQTPVINASISTNFPSSMVLAWGALVYYRYAEDPQTDISQLDQIFEEELEEVIATQIRNQPDKPVRTRQRFRGTYTGDIET